MADNYTQFSEKITDLTQKEYAWLLQVLQTDMDELTPIQQRQFAEKYELGGIDFEWGWPGFNYAFEDNGTTFWMVAEEYVNLDNLAKILHSFMKQNKRKGVIKITWADTCSSPRIGEFCGGALVVSAKTFRMQNAWELAEEIASEIPQE